MSKKAKDWHKKKLAELVERHGIPSAAEMETSMAASVAAGDMEVAGKNAAGQTTYRLTAQGIARARGLAGDFTD